MLSRVRIRNFKAFRDQDVLLAPLTLLTGLNGSGKSSLMQTLLLLRQSAESGILDRRQLLLNGGLARIGAFQDALFEGAAEERISFELVDSTGRGFDWHFWFDSLSSRTSTLSAELPHVAWSDLALFSPNFRFLCAERIGPRVTYGLADRELDAVGLGTQGEWTGQFLARHRDKAIAIKACEHPNAASSKLLHQVEAWMGEFSPGLRLAVESDEMRDSVALRYSFEARRSVSNSYRPTNVGFGISYTLPVVVAILAANPGDLILIEAPEAHLHPRGQARIGHLLATAAQDGVQFIVETHSDHIVNGVRVAVHQDVIQPENTAFLYFRWDPKAEDGATTVEHLRPDSHGRIEHWPEGFFDEMDKSLDALLQPKGPRQ